MQDLLLHGKSLIIDYGDCTGCCFNSKDVRNCPTVDGELLCNVIEYHPESEPNKSFCFTEKKEI